MAENTVDWFSVREKYYSLAYKPWLISQIRPSEQANDFSLPFACNNLAEHITNLHPFLIGSLSVHACLCAHDVTLTEPIETKNPIFSSHGTLQLNSAYCPGGL